MQTDKHMATALGAYQITCTVCTIFFFLLLCVLLVHVLSKTPGPALQSSFVLSKRGNIRCLVSLLEEQRLLQDFGNLKQAWKTPPSQFELPADAKVRGCVNNVVQDLSHSQIKMSNSCVQRSLSITNGKMLLHPALRVVFANGSASIACVAENAR